MFTISPDDHVIFRNRLGAVEGIRTRMPTVRVVQSPKQTTNQAHQTQSVYSDMKSTAQGLMDFALLTANASQLRSVIRAPSDQQYHTANIVMISLSIAFQVSPSTEKQSYCNE